MGKGEQESGVGRAREREWKLLQAQERDICMTCQEPGTWRGEVPGSPYGCLSLRLLAVRDTEPEVATS